jgi:hypothetical protein
MEITIRSFMGPVEGLRERGFHHSVHRTKRPMHGDIIALRDQVYLLWNPKTHDFFQFPSPLLGQNIVSKEGLTSQIWAQSINSFSFKIWFYRLRSFALTLSFITPGDQQLEYWKPMENHHHSQKENPKYVFNSDMHQDTCKAYHVTCNGGK